MKSKILYYSLLFFFVFLCLTPQKYFSQVLECGQTTPVEPPPGATYPNLTTVLRGGENKTSTGTLKVLVVFVRFKDDTQNTTSWLDYNVLPSWASSIVNASIPSNNIYTPENLSDIFDRASGGNGTGTLGSFKVIGDVYYVTTDENESYYNKPGTAKIDAAKVNKHALEKLNSQVNYADYDNWTFMQGNKFFTHSNTSDGIVDHIFMIWREDNTSLPTTAGLSGIGLANNLILDGKTIDKNFSGTQHFDYKNYSDQQTRIKFLAHEYAHLIFGGSHLDHTYTANEGNVEMFGLMFGFGGSNTFFNSFERYRAGWLNPTICTSNQTIYLGDSYVANQAALIPIRYDANSNIVEYFLVENFQNRNDYSTANPFTVKSIFGKNINRGLLVFHVEDEHLQHAMDSKLDIETAEGMWNWQLATGSGTPSSRADDLLGHLTPSYNSGFDERDIISLTVGSITYTDYQCLKASSYSGSSPNHGWRYTKDAYLGETEDFFNPGYVQVFSNWSNPSTKKADNSTSNVAFEVVGYNSSTKQYTLNVAVNSSGAQALAPSKPQNLKITSVSNHPYLTWAANTESDISAYYIYRSYNGGTWQNIAYTSQTYYQDNGVNVNSPIDNFEYRIKAYDTQAKYSVESEKVSIKGFLIKSNSKTEPLSPNEFKLFHNYPNPFNPTTVISYNVPQKSFVTLKEITNLVNENKEAGYHSIEFNASNLPSGVYFYKIMSGNFSEIKKMILMK